MILNEGSNKRSNSNFSDRFIFSKMAQTIWTVINSLAIIASTVWIGVQQVRIAENANEIAKSELVNDRIQNTNDRKQDLSGSDAEYAILQKAFLDGPQTSEEVDAVLLKLRPMRRRLIAMADCISSEACLNNEDAVSFFCRYATVYEGTVRAWLRDLEREREIPARNYGGLFERCSEK